MSQELGVSNLYLNPRPRAAFAAPLSGDSSLQVIANIVEARRIADDECVIRAIQKYVPMGCIRLNSGSRKAGNGHLDQNLIIKHYLLRG